MILRAARTADAPAIREVVHSVLREHGLEPDPSGADACLDDVEASYVAKGGTFDVLVDEAGKIVGTVGLMPHGNGVCELRKMYLLPEARGRGQGRRVLEHALAEARRLGFRRVELETAAPLKAAMALYEKAGFKRLERSIAVARCDRAYALDLEPLEQGPFGPVMARMLRWLAATYRGRPRSPALQLTRLLCD